MPTTSSRPSLRGPVYGALAACLLVASQAQAFPALNLTPGTPDIESAFITVNYNSATGELTADGFAQVLAPPGAPLGDIVGGIFDITATINDLAQTASGTLSITGTIASEGFNSGTLLTGTFSSTAANQTFGAGPGDPLEFLFDITGGDAVALFGGVGSTAGVILSQSGYTGSFAVDFTNTPPGAAPGGLADTFREVPEPAPLALMLLGAGVIAVCRRKRLGGRLASA